MQAPGIERSEESKSKREQRLKKDCLIPKRIPKRKKKAKAHEMRTKAIERFGETRKFKGQYETNIGDKKQSGRCNSEVIGFLREIFEQVCKFRSENL